MSTKYLTINKKLVMSDGKLVQVITSDGATPNLQSKNITYTSNGLNVITADSGYDGLKRVNVKVNVPTKEEQEKSVTITENGTTTVTPDSGKVLSKVTVTTNVATEDLTSVIDEQETLATQNQTLANEIEELVNNLKI